MSVMGVAAILQGLLDGHEVLPRPLREAIARHAVDAQSLEQRLDRALNGLRPA